MTSANDLSSVAGELEAIRECSGLMDSEACSADQAPSQEAVPGDSASTSTQAFGCGCGGACGGHSHNRMDTPKARQARTAGFSDLSEGRPNLGLRARR
ncbi:MULTISPECIES: hypothetical protein [unclassified Actinobaculum]|uniref:hypothetical protein n=1 Tax=unclassified Actinobaculum TaxID=2609299 RepID=UPI000F73BE32|nr:MULTISPECIES: hypothetical protein [unclassified Actinobaculum]RTE47970.1 hypothetical protein EKN07_11475 [Actinobaculum sp. 352]